MEVDRLKLYLQEFMADGLALVVGSGLSCAEGLPGMTTLVHAINGEVSAYGKPADVTEWEVIRALCPSKGLEYALQQHPPSTNLDLLIRQAVSQAICSAENRVFEEVTAGKRTLPLSGLLKWVSFPPTGLPIITTNYDRLIELACEHSDVHVDTLFDGQVYGRLSPDRWKYSQIDELRSDGARNRPVFRKFARVLKPHGSVDWWDTPTGPIRFGGALQSNRMMITPGVGKYRAGYNEPYDTQRNEANQSLNASERVMLIGYGFNDDHLEATRLVPDLKGGKPSLLLTRELTANAKNILATAGKMTALEALDPHTGNGTRIFHRGEVKELPDEQWWSLGHFVEGIIKP